MFTRTHPAAGAGPLETSGRATPALVLPDELPDEMLDGGPVKAANHTANADGGQKPERELDPARPSTTPPVRSTTPTPATTTTTQAHSEEDRTTVEEDRSAATTTTSPTTRPPTSAPPMTTTPAPSTTTDGSTPSVTTAATTTTTTEKPAGNDSSTAVAPGEEKEPETVRVHHPEAVDEGDLGLQQPSAADLGGLPNAKPEPFLEDEAVKVIAKCAL